MMCGKILETESSGNAAKILQSATPNVKMET
jgi:hypothetical protein